MKKLFSLLLASSILVSLAFGQETSFGLKAGINVASLETSGNDYNSKAGLHIGGLAHIHLSPHVALQPELVLSMQGGQYNSNNKVNLNYINIPLLLQYMANGGLRLETGPQLGFLASAKSKSGNVTVDIKDNLSSTDFSWAFGIGYLFPQGVGIDGRFNLGLNNVNDDDDFTLKNRVFQIGVFYQFPHAATHRRK